MKKLSKTLLIVTGAILVTINLAYVILQPLLFDSWMIILTFGFYLMGSIPMLISHLFGLVCGILVLLAGIINNKPLLILALVSAFFLQVPFCPVAILGCSIGLYAIYKKEEQVVAVE